MNGNDLIQFFWFYVSGVGVAMAVNLIVYEFMFKKRPYGWEDITFLVGGSWVTVLIQVVAAGWTLWLTRKWKKYA